ncbi:hypothetical protein P9314_23705 [Paenibacillus validus]|uniref:hypothetical protein n=1 Tax=Paenibacillus TaxID=44249 RepID=UPI0013DF45D1|nr:MULTISPECIES: hypothetical protein [Paenibacillus]MED4603638.1 hypothetical protein [Paenibacillus validus]MED4607087.1 hypothetical protein [Paenibacillus validus]
MSGRTGRLDEGAAGWPANRGTRSGFMADGFMADVAGAGLVVDGVCCVYRPGMK